MGLAFADEKVYGLKVSGDPYQGQGGTFRPIELSFQNDPDTVDFIRAEDYDPEQHAFLNKASLSPVGDGAPGANHSLIFNKSYVYIPDETHSITVEDDASFEFTTGDVLRIEAHIRLSDYTPAASRSIMSKWNTTGNQRSYRFYVTPTGELKLDRSQDGSAVGGVTSSASLSTSAGDDVWVAVEWDITANTVDFYTSADGSSWSALGTQQSFGVALTPFDSSSALAVGSESAGASPLVGFLYTALIKKDGTTLATFTATDFVPGNRGHGATVDDAQDNTWTVNRAGSPLSVLDIGDGNGKFILNASQISPDGLTSNQKPNLSAKDLFLWARVQKSGAGGVHHIVGQWGANTDESVRLVENPSGFLRVDYTTDGSTDVAHTNNTKPSWWDSLSVGWVGVLYDHSEGDWLWYDGGTGSTPSWSLIETDTGSPVTIWDEEDSIPVTVGVTANGDQEAGNRIYQAGIGASTSSLYDYSHFSAALIDRWDWRVNNCVEASSKSGEAWAVNYTDDSEDSNDPPVPYWNGDNFAYMAEGANYIWQNTSQAIANGSVISVRADIRASDYISGADQAIFASRLYFELDSTGDLYYAFDGTSGFPAAQSSVPLPVVDGQRVQVRADHDHTNDTVDFYYRYDYTIDLTNNSGWTALGTQQSITNVDLDTVITSGVFATRFGSDATDGFTGNCYRGIVVDDGATVFDVNLANAGTGDGTSFTSAHGTATHVRTTTGLATAAVTEPVILFGGAHYIVVPYHPDLDNYPLTCGLAFRAHDFTTGWQQWITRKANSSGNTVGWQWQSDNTNDRMLFSVANGSANANVGFADADANYVASSRAAYVAAIDDGDLEGYLDGETFDTDATSITPIATTDDLVIGANGGKGNLVQVGEIFALVILSKRLSDKEALDLSNELARV